MKWVVCVTVCVCVCVCVSGVLTVPMAARGGELQGQGAMCVVRTSRAHASRAHTLITRSTGELSVMSFLIDSLACSALE